MAAVIIDLEQARRARADAAAAELSTLSGPDIGDLALLLDRAARRLAVCIALLVVMLVAGLVLAALL